MVNEHWLQFSKSPVTLALHKRVSLSFEALKPGTDFSPAMKVLGGTVFLLEAVSSTLKICLVQPPSLIIWGRSSGKLATASPSAHCTFYIIHPAL